MLNLKNKGVLVTGGTGSFGKSFIRFILTNHPEIERLVVFSRDELKQFEMQQEFDKNEFPQLRFFLGDIRDVNRLKELLKEFTMWCMLPL